MSEKPIPPKDGETAAISDGGTIARSVRASSAPTEWIGNYRLIKKIGEGGMGEVYEAEQTKPIRRTVALKLIKWGMDTKAGMARFEAERQTLAVMDHSNIAKVHDAGSTEKGRMYFVMEFVKGLPITAFCDQERLTNRERLHLFSQVCEGIQHAHQKGIIHRDIKSSNVLVARQDGKPVPKIIDFGVAKTIDRRLTEQTVFTEVGQLIGTPEYMSPEQAGLTGLDIDTRSDVYSLGVLLYELIVGALPFESQALRRKGFDEIRRIIREEEPRKPSTRILAPDYDTKTAAGNRRTDPPSLKKQLRGDLDWVVMKAMAKDRDRRYSSVSELASDVSRYLRNAPVTAGPPSPAYRVRKYVLRHKVGVAAAALVLMALVIGVAGTTVGLIKARRAEKRAVAEAATARSVSDFLVRLFEVSDPGESRGNTITAREILDTGVSKIGTELREQPAIQARLLMTMGQVYEKLGLYASAEKLVQRSLELKTQLDGGESLPVAEVLQSLGNLQYYQARYGESLETFKRVLAVREKTLGANHPDVAAANNDLGVLLASLGRYDEAESRYLRALKVREETLPADHSLLSETIYNLGVMYGITGRYANAENFLKRSLAIKERTLAPDHPELADTLGSLGWALSEQGRYQEAAQVQERALAIREKVLPAGHPQIASSLEGLGNLYIALDEPEKAEAAFLRAQAVLLKNSDPNSHDFAAVQDGLAYLARDNGRYAEAEELLKGSLRMKERALGPDHRDLGLTLGQLANLYRDLGRYDEAHALYKRTLTLREKAIGPGHPEVGLVLGGWSLCYFQQGRFQDAEPLALRSLQVLEKALQPQHPNVAWAALILADLYCEKNRYEDAELLYQRALAIYEKSVRADHRDFKKARANHAKCVQRAGRRN